MPSRRAVVEQKIWDGRMAHRRFPRFAPTARRGRRNDKRERAVVRRERLLKERATAKGESCVPSRRVVVEQKIGDTRMAHCRFLASLGGCDFFDFVIVCGWKAPKSICEQALPGSFDSAQ